MGRAMTLATFPLRARLRLARINPVMALILALVVGGAAVQIALIPARARVNQAYDAARVLARTPLPVRPAPAVAPPSSDQNLAQFYATLGDPRAVERQLKQVFALAARHGLSLQQGEYRTTADRNAKMLAYQVNLPVKGSYGAIWQFAMDVLRAIPHASLDDVAFRRDTISQDGVEARLRLTFYLAERPTQGATP
jgi:hypothetical protein